MLHSIQGLKSLAVEQVIKAELLLNAEQPNSCLVVDKRVVGLPVSLCV